MTNTHDRKTEPLRQCPNTRCQRVLTQHDERRGKCPSCGWLLLTLAPREAFDVAFIQKARKSE